MAPLKLVGTESGYNLSKTAKASSTSEDSSPTEAGPCRPRPRRQRPCQVNRKQYRKLFEKAARQIEKNPSIVDVDNMELKLPRTVKRDPWLQHKFMSRIGLLKQKYLAEQQHEMYAPGSVKLQEESSNTLAENGTSELKPLDSLIQPKKVDVGNMDREEQHLDTEMNTADKPLRVLHDEGDGAPATVIRIPNVEDIGLPMKLLSSMPTVTGVQYE